MKRSNHLLAQALVCGCVMAACGPGATAGSPRRYSADPAHYVTQIDDLASPDFRVEDPIHHVTLAEAEFQMGATVRYFRDAGALSTSNGPVDVIDTATRFASSSGATATLEADIARREHQAHETAISTGPLGDQAHGDLAFATTGGVQVVQVTVEWRTANLLSAVVIRGRYGGTRLEDALTLAQRQRQREGEPAAA